LALNRAEQHITAIACYEGVHGRPLGNDATVQKVAFRISRQACFSTLFAAIVVSSCLRIANAQNVTDSEGSCTISQ
jgi:hypothetical protein